MRIVLYDEVSTAVKEKETEDLLYDEVPTADKEKEAEDLLYDEVPTAAKEKEAEGQGQGGQDDGYHRPAPGHLCHPSCWRQDSP